MTDLLTVAEAADELGITRRQVLRWIKSGRLRARKLPGHTSPWLIRREELDAVLASIEGGKPEAAAS
jgi:excisionase family DNA binding protein